MKSSIEKLIANYYGLDMQALSKYTFSNAVAFRMSFLGIETQEAYYQKLLLSTKERDELIELLVVNETWFFRDQGSFDFLAHYIRDEWPTMGKGKVLNVLSLPCSTGEEPYSIAIALLEAGMASHNFLIDGIDISYKSLEKAQTATYSAHSFRNKKGLLNLRYFEKLPTEEVSIKKFIKARVSFFRWNILDNHFLKNRGPYDIIFFKNLLIYFHERAQKQALSMVGHLLAKEGIAITAAAETDLFRMEGYVAMRPLQSYAFHRTTQ